MNEFKNIHFIGIGGIGMSAIAQMLARLGCRVSGSDVKESSVTRQLEAMGVRVQIGHRMENVRGAECVVFSSSIANDNPELAEARRAGVAVKHRSQMLAFLSADKWTAAVSGTHGKSTTTSMLGWVYERCGKDPTVVVGARVEQLGGNFLFGAGPDMILEADESDSSFLEYRPDAIIVTNIDSDHLDHFKNIDAIEDTFKRFLGRLKPGGRWYGCAEDARVKKLLGTVGGGVSYGFGPGAGYTAADPRLLGAEGSCFTLRGPAGEIGEVRLKVFGMHNILNATAVCALALEQGLAFAKVREAAGSFRGAARRFDLKLFSEDIAVIDDYAHHPTEIRSTLAAARGFSQRRLVVVFQPHRFSRTALLQEEFAACFDLADELIVTDIYAAGEAPIDGIDSERLSRLIAARRTGPTSYVPKASLTEELTRRIRRADVVITMGAGDIGETANELKKIYEYRFSHV